MIISSVMLYCAVLLMFAGDMGQLAQAGSSPVIINEALANEPGSAVSLEWVELYNQADTSVDLSDYVFIDAKDTTAMIGLVLQSGEYAILARRLTGDPGQDSFESYWGNGSGEWGDTELESYLALAVPMRLRNTADTVELRGPGDAVSRFFWDSATEDGISLERSRPDSPDEPTSFLSSIDGEGSTPGRINSRTPRPNDLTIDSAGIEIAPYPPRETEPVTITVPVINVGLGSSAENSITIADDEDTDGIITEAEILAVVNVPTLEEGQSTTVSYTGLLPGGVHHLLLVLGEDGNISNNTVKVIFKVSHAQPEIVINEYLPDPLPGYSEEWIELYNRSSQPVDIKDWKIGDSVSQSVITTDVELILPGGFVIVCEDLAAFQMTYPDAQGFVIYEIGGWRALNNSGDRIVLLDNFGFVVDSLTYLTTYDGERSIERVNPDIPSGNADNWWGSVDTSGATPGRENSTAVEYSDALEVSVSPNPFASGQPVWISYSTPFRTLLTARVYDVNGRKVKTLFADQPSVTGVIEWDGTDENGKALSPGVYVMLFETDRGTGRKIVLAVSPAD